MLEGAADDLLYIFSFFREGADHGQFPFVHKSTSAKTDLLIHMNLFGTICLSATEGAFLMEKCFGVEIALLSI